MLDSIVSLFAPHNCLVCGHEGQLLCADCQPGLPMPGERCYGCHRLSTGNRTCVPCRRGSCLYAVQVRTLYEGPAKELIYRFKFSGAKAAAHPAAEMMLPLVPADVEIIVPVPTASRRIRTRGYDQAFLLARQLGRRASRPVGGLLLRSGHARQVGASRVQRRQQLQGVFHARDVARIQGRHILLIDDVMTTGATLEAAASALKAAGARRVSALVFARP